MIERYFHTEDGYNPFLIRKGWQVAQLNYVAKHGLDDIDDVEMHALTDEVFILMRGRAALITASFEGDEPTFEVENMQVGVTYNIPAGVWHNIAMDKDAQIIIVERNNTHLEDVAHKTLTDEQLQRVYAQINAAL